VNRWIYSDDFMGRDNKQVLSLLTGIIEKDDRQSRPSGEGERDELEWTMTDLASGLAARGYQLRRHPGTQFDLNLPLCATFITSLD
jgi:hypothetical protein